MKAVWLLALNDFRLTLRRPSVLVWTLLLPLVLMWLLGHQGSAGPMPEQVTLRLVDHDHGWFSQAVADQLRGHKGLIVEAGPAGADAGEPREALAGHLVILPAGLSEGLLRGETQTVRLELDAQAGGDFGLLARAHVATAIARSLLRFERLAARGQLPEAGIPDWRSSDIADAAEKVSLKVTQAGRGELVPSGFAQSVPGTLTMTVLMMTLIYGGMFLAMERQHGHLQRLLTAPLSRIQVFWGKLGGRLMIAGIQIFLLMLVGRLFFGLRFEDRALALVLVLGSFALAVASLGTLLGTLAKSPEQAKAVGWIAGMVMAGLGGCWWPGEVMSDWLWKWAHALPTTWAMEGFHEVLSYGHGLRGALLPVLVLSAFAVLYSLVGARYFDSRPGV